MFNYSPTPGVLHGLAKGRLADRLQRSIRLWLLLHQFYGHPDWARRLPQPFRYADVRDRLFATTHGRSDTDSITTLSAACDSTCRCQQSLQILLEQSPLPYSVSQWQQTTSDLTDLSGEQLTKLLQQYPFATVHRSIRADLTYLADLGWLKKEKQGYFYTIEPQHWPEIVEHPLLSADDSSNNALGNALGNLSNAQAWEVLRALESISFVQPDLDIIIQSIWETLTAPLSAQSSRNPQEPERRIFIHLDYILSDTVQEHVDTLQEQIEQLWRDGNSGVIRFHYSYKSISKKNRPIPITVYPVCLHYARRAKYLSAYGIDPLGVFGWHNYRLDRITSPKLTLLDWNHRQVPKLLKRLHSSNTLPNSQVVSTALEAAWGFNFYLPRKLLIMRFPPAFAERYVHQTDRHPTFEPIAYKALPALVKKEIKGSSAQSNVLETLKHKDPKDQYYRAWIRLGDINIVMRLRDWRPNGEVIAPVVLREQMRQESQAELLNYKL